MHPMYQYISPVQAWPENFPRHLGADNRLEWELAGLIQGRLAGDEKNKVCSPSHVRWEQYKLRSLPFIPLTWNLKRWEGQHRHGPWLLQWIRYKEAASSKNWSLAKIIPHLLSPWLLIGEGIETGLLHKICCSSISGELEAYQDRIKM